MRLGLVVALAALSCVGCAKDKGMFVLVPDADGNVGSISVTNEAGSTTLTREGEATYVESSATEPESGTLTDKEDIQRRFGQALGAEPPRPAVFHFSFASDSAQITGEASTLLDEVMNEILKRESRDISVNGHTDSTGDDAYNMQLSLQRAHAIRDALVERGANAADIATDYHGDRDPLVPTPDGQAEPRNRRVEVVVR